MFKKKYKASLPLILNEITKQALKYNLMRDRWINDFERSFRCISFAFDGSTMLEFGINKNKTNPNYQDYTRNKKYSTHSEISLLIKLNKKKIRKVTDIIAIRGTTKLLDSYPCPLCMAHLIDCLEKTRLWYFKYNKWHVELL